MKIKKSSINAILLLLISTCNFASPHLSTEEVSFLSFKNERLNGIISRPEGGDAKSIVIVVHGYGATNVVEGDWYKSFRSNFTEKGVSVVIWDKPGCGKSEGEFDINQPVQSSAEEILAAINQLKKDKEPGSDQIGLWSASRGGWIAPLAISQATGIKFWISVSGTNAYESWGYLLRSSLEIAGHTVDEIDAVYDAWVNKNKMLWEGVDYESYLKVSRVFWMNETVQKLTGQNYVSHNPGSQGYKKDRELYHFYQKKWVEEGNTYDKKLGLQIVIPEFNKILENVSIPVLAIFGDKDKNVDWRKTKALYENTLGLNGSSNLTVKVFENADHSLKLSKTGGYLESQEPEYWNNPTVDGYYQVMLDWLCSHEFCTR